jgi:hypothetical protein
MTHRSICVAVWQRVERATPCFETSENGTWKEPTVPAITLRKRRFALKWRRRRFFESSKHLSARYPEIFWTSLPGHVLPLYVTIEFTRPPPNYSTKETHVRSIRTSRDSQDQHDFAALRNDRVELTSAEARIEVALISCSSRNVSLSGSAISTTHKRRSPPRCRPVWALFC